jgi:hypothetical protein
LRTVCHNARFYDTAEPIDEVVAQMAGAVNYEEAGDCHSVVATR